MDLLKKFLPCIGFFILIFIVVYKINFESLINVICKINFTYLIPGIIFSFLVTFLKMVRTYKILKQNNITIPFLNFLEIYVNANILSQVTNLLFSETTAAIATMHKKENKTRVANIFFLANFSDLVSVISLFLLSLFLNYKTVISIIAFNFSSQKNILILFGAILIILVLFIIFYKFILKVVMNILKDLNMLIRKSWKKLIFFSIIIYGCYVIACFFNAKTFNINISFLYILLVFTSGSLINIIPISINGLGTREAAFILLLKLKDISPEQAFSLSFFSFVIIILFNLTIMYISIIILKYIKKKK